MSNKSIATITTMGIDIGKNSFHVVGLDRRGAIVLRQKWSRPSNRRVRSYPNSGCARIRPGTPASGQERKWRQSPKSTVSAERRRSIACSTW